MPPLREYGAGLIQLGWRFLVFQKDRGALRRTHGIARRERFEAPREWPGQGRIIATSLEN